MDKRFECGPFDTIGDVHGCADELERLLNELGHVVRWDDRTVECAPAPGRRIVFLGDLVDRGPRTPDTLRLAMGMVQRGHALAVIGNHDDKFLRWMKGRDVKISHGMALSIQQLEKEDDAFKARVRDFLDAMPSHYWLDQGQLVVAHAGLKEVMFGLVNRDVRSFALYGETTGESDANGTPVRKNWARDYRGQKSIIYGHTPTREAIWLNNALCIDTGCVFGGNLTALRWPERDIVSIPARKTYYAPARPF